MISQKQKRIILDCDPGVDDAMAIIFALKSGSLIIDSITTVNGNVSVEQTTTNALKILEFMGRTDIPVAMGADRPLVVDPVHSKYVFGEDGLGNISSTLPHSKRAIEKDAVTHILDRVREGNIDAIVGIGPLTNIANAYKQNKQLMNSVNELIVMGGAINVKGNITEFAEFNFYCDPHAADYVLENSTNLTLIPLDVTTKARFCESDLETLNQSKVSNLIKTITRIWFEFSKNIGQDGIALHDPLAIGFSINGEFGEIQKINLRVSLLEDKRGQCEVIKTKNYNSHMNYCSSLNAMRFMNYFMKKMNL